MTILEKPRLRKIGVLWFCWSHKDGTAWGHTPEEAFTRWKNGEAR